MSFLYPSFLWLILPLLVFLWQKKSQKIGFIIQIIILILLLLALSRPIVPDNVSLATVEAKDIIVAIDVSYSMKAKDIRPNRYDFAKETIRALLIENPNTNVMLIAFTSNPLLLSPPTTDHTLITIALESLNPEFILTKGTSLKKLFSKIASINQQHKEVILISDGGEEQDLNALHQSLVRGNITLHILALGSKEGSTVENENKELLTDKEGHLVISRINPLLQDLAMSVNGTYIEASSTAEHTAKLLSHSLSTSQSYRSQKMQKQPKEYYALPLFLAVFLFFLLHTKGINYLLIALAFFGVEAQASLLDTYHLISAYESYTHQDFESSRKHLNDIKTPSLQSHILLAHSYYKEKKYKKALKIYQAIRSSSVPIKQANYYHIANTYAQLQKYSKARYYYSQALALGKDKDTSYNLNLIALRLDKDPASLGIAHPKSQSDTSTPNKASSKENSKEEDKPSTSHAGAGEGKSKKAKKTPDKVIADKEQAIQERPLGSKVYELINKGYIHEARPW
jgi:Ca-activated chloride channel family protein